MDELVSPEPRSPFPSHEPTRRRREDPLTAALAGVERAKAYLFSIQKEDGHWCAELESNATITAEYVFLCQALGLELDGRRENLVRYFRGNQKEDGSWGIAWNHAGDVSTTSEVYLALRILGVEEGDAGLRRAQAFIRGSGGLEKIRIFTRINFAMFGLFPWEAVPVIPPEFILVPPQSPVNIYALSSWARGTMVPLFIIFHHQPVFALPNGRSARNGWLDHLWLDPRDKRVPYRKASLEVVRKDGLGWKALFTASDSLLKAFDKLKPSRLREHAVRKCEEWVLEHQEESGDWAGIFPPMLNGVLALYLNGYSLRSDPVRRGLEAIERFGIDDERGYRIQACVSPVWDTVLSLIGILDSGHDVKDSRLGKARDWITRLQLLVDHGDWRVYNPTGPSGGWSFEYVNTWYPDVDDTAAILIGFMKHDPSTAKTTVVQRAAEWVLSMQNRDGGWAAFDIDNDKTFLNEIPFSDMDSLCDPSSPDVTGRVLEAFGLIPGLLGEERFHEACKRGITYLRASQEEEGSWFGRWGVNYVYGTSNVLCALLRQKIPGTDPMVEAALAWLRARQNADGGWGEALESYSDKSRMGRGPSTASQTAWALMGLLAYLTPSDPAVKGGVRWLLSRQTGEGTWHEREFTGTGFPNHFYINYHLYRHYFPMMALGRFCQARLS